MNLYPVDNASSFPDTCPLWDSDLTLAIQRLNSRGQDIVVHYFFLGVCPSFSQLDWINKVYPNPSPKDKPVECIQEEGEILYLVSLKIN